MRITENYTVGQMAIVMKLFNYSMAPLRNLFMNIKTFIQGETGKSGKKISAPLNQSE